jgi:hypothetical protein
MQQKIKVKAFARSDDSMSKFKIQKSTKCLLYMSDPLKSKCYVLKFQSSLNQKENWITFREKKYKVTCLLHSDDGM